MTDHRVAKFLTSIFLIWLSCLFLPGVVQSQPVDVEWTNMTGIGVSGTTLTKTASSGWTNAGASSENYLDAGVSGYVEIPVTDLTSGRALGLTGSYTGPDFRTFDYAVYLRGDLIYVYHSGQLMGQFGKVISNDVIRIQRQGSFIYYKKNGSTFYSASSSLDNAFVAAVSIYHQNANVTDIQCDFSGNSTLEAGITKETVTSKSTIYLSDIDIEGTPPYSLTSIDEELSNYEVDESNLSITEVKAGKYKAELVDEDGYNIKMDFTVGMEMDWMIFTSDYLTVEEISIPKAVHADRISFSGEGLTVTRPGAQGSGGNWEAQLVSYNFFSEERDSYIDFVIPDIISTEAIGLKSDAVETETSSYNDIEYGFLFEEGNYSIIHNGEKLDIGGFTAGDRFQMAIKNDMTTQSGIIYYSVNGVVIKSFLLNETHYKYLLKIAIYSIPGSITNLICVSNPPEPVLKINISELDDSENPLGSVTVETTSPEIFSDFTYEWFDESENLIGEEDAISDLEEGNYTLLVTYQTENSQTRELTETVVISRGSPPAYLNICSNDEERNWIQTIIFDDNGDPISESKVYFNELGKKVQVQTKLETDNDVIAIQTIYDAYGRKILATLPAPLGQTELCFKENFVTNTNSDDYSYSDFDLPYSTNAAGEVNNPDPVQSTTSGTLGWYYSNSNTVTPYAPATGFPYSRVEYDENNPGEIKRVSSADYQLRMGGGHETYSFSMSSSGELFHLFGYGYDWYDPELLNSPSSFNFSVRPLYNTIKTISEDQNGHQSVVFQDLDGNIVAKALAGSVDGVNQREMKVESIINALNPYIDIHIPEGCDNVSNSNNITLTNQCGEIKILNLKTGQYLTSSTITTNLPTLAPGFYRLIWVDGGPNCLATLQYKLNYYDFTLYYYDAANRLKAIVPPKGIASNYNPGYVTLTNSSSLEIEDIPDYYDTYWETYLQLDEMPTSGGQDHFSIAGYGYLDYVDVDNSWSTSNPYTVFLDNDNNPNTFDLSISTSTSTEIKFTDLQVSLTDKNYTLPTNVNSLAKSTSSSNTTVSANVFSDEDASWEAGPTGPDQPEPPHDEAVTFKFTFLVRAVNGSGTIKDYYINSTTHPTELRAKLFITHGNPDEYEWQILTPPVSLFIDPSVHQQITEVQFFIADVQVEEGLSTFLSSATDIMPQLAELKFNMWAKTKTLNAAPAHTMASTYEYNSLGWKLSETTPDAGKASFVYRKDGSLKFSQNAKQFSSETVMEINKFSYCNYDDAGRVIEGGVYDPASSGVNPPALFETHDGNVFSPTIISGYSSVHTTSILEQTGYTLNDGHRSEQVYLSYDIPDENLSSEQELPAEYHQQKFLRGRVSRSWNENSSTWYSYNEFGRLLWTAQLIYAMDNSNDLWKTVDYEYDFNGNVTRVIYQKNVEAERFYHFYVYDRDKRLKEVYTSRDGVSKDKQAQYLFYRHGPLQRVELGKGLQAMDFVYTINGWLKSINSPDLDKTRDPGKDGTISSHNNFAKDLFGMSLDYFSDDYYRGNTHVQTFDDSNYPDEAPNLYNGIIKAQRWRTAYVSGWESNLQHYDNELFYGYTYDKQYQLLQASFADVTDVGTMCGIPPDPNDPQPGYEGPLILPVDDYKVSDITYDPNGNLYTLNRNGYNLGGGNGISMDEMSYTYNGQKNQLNKVVDGESANNFNNLEFQPQQVDNNYLYNEIGQLTADINAALYYDYNAAGLVKGVYKQSNHSEPLVTFDYDEKGQRIKKTNYFMSGDFIGEPSVFTRYVRDASGNVLSIYRQENTDLGGPFPTLLLGPLGQEEINVYGSSRIGVYSPATGKTTYELSDHLGNVRTTFTADKMTTNITTDFEGTGDYDYLFDFNANIDDNFDYDANGTSSVKTKFPGMQYGTGIFGIEVHPNDVIDATFYSYYNSAQAPTDPNVMIVFDLYDEFGNQLTNEWLGGPIINVNGSWQYNQHLYTVNPVLTGNKYFLSIYFWNPEFTNSTSLDVWFDDLNINIYPYNQGASGIDVPMQLSLTDYYPHGSVMPGRNISNSPGYRYEYQGQVAEKDPETGLNSFELRMYDPLLGRWFVRDPYSQYHSPYLAMGNNPICNIDPNGGISIPIPWFFMHFKYWEMFGGPIIRNLTEFTVVEKRLGWFERFVSKFKRNYRAGGNGFWSWVHRNDESQDYRDPKSDMKKAHTTFGGNEIQGNGMRSSAVHIESPYVDGIWNQIMSGALAGTVANAGTVKIPFKLADTESFGAIGEVTDALVTATDESIEAVNGVGWSDPNLVVKYPKGKLLVQSGYTISEMVIPLNPNNKLLVNRKWLAQESEVDWTWFRKK